MGTQVGTNQIQDFYLEKGKQYIWVVLTWDPKLHNMYPGTYQLVPGLLYKIIEALCIRNTHPELDSYRP